MRGRGENHESRRRLGQFFTPAPVAELAVAAALDSPGQGAHEVGHPRVIDPTCGPGRMLCAASETNAHALGIEIDPVLAALARLPVGARPRGRPHGRVEVIEGEAFSTVAGFGGARIAPRAFDAVLGNPPYVRYQALAQLAARADPALVRAAARAFGGRPLSRQVDALVRCALIAPLWPAHTRSLARRLSELERVLADPPASWDGGTRAFAQLVRAYSGLSDLALPTWLLTWVLARPEGRVAFVANESPARREYGRVLRYFQLRFLQPLLVVEPADAAWFPGAQVPASLQVFRVRPPHELAIPLSEQRTNAQLVRIRLGPDPQHRRVRELTQRLRAAPLERADLRGFAVRREPLAAMVAGVLAEGEGAGKHRGWLARVEQREHGQLSLSSSLAPPPEIARVMPPGPYARLWDLGVSTHQGLRTGCNTFFYLRRDADGRVHPDAVFGCAPFEPETGHPELAGLFRPVVRRQRDLAGARARVDASALAWVAFVAGARACPHELAALARYPASWRRAWIDAGQLPLPEPLARWIERAAATSLTIRGKATPIPSLSAVAPNARGPRPSASGGADVPAPPRFWYTLPLAPRHDAPLLMARVIHHAPAPRLNDARAPALVDSNFVTFTFARDAPQPTAVLALLASTYVAACLESHATPMGGGALKVEAAHLRQLPVPTLSHEAWSQLSRLGEQLSTRPSARTLARIDAVLVPERARVRLARLADDLRTRRRARAGAGGG